MANVVLRFPRRPSSIGLFFKFFDFLFIYFFLIFLVKGRGGREGRGKIHTRMVDKMMRMGVCTDEMWIGGNPTKERGDEDLGGERAAGGW